MDFGTLLNVAQKNGSNKQPIACYQTKFAPPKKPTKQAKTLSENIKKFLARKEEEEKRKALEEKQKKSNLLSLRDHKAQSRINKHLKVCKAANKSVLEDAIDNENTAVTMAGPSQPDEDDYGYVSQEASAFYNQLMNKYNNAPPEKPLFSDSKKRTIKDIASTKDRVKQALKQQEAEEALGHRRKRKHSAKEIEVESEEKVKKGVEDDRKERDREREKEKEREREKEKEERPKPKKKSMPPPIDFSELLKIAEKKQHEPIVIDVKPKTEEPERLMTSKQMKEYAKEKEWRERKEQRNKVGSTNKEGNNTTLSKSNKMQDSRSGLSSIDKTPKSSEKLPASSVSSKAPSKTVTGTPIPKKITEKTSENKPTVNKSTVNKPNVPKTSEKDVLLEERKKLEMERKKLEEMRQAIEDEKKKLKLSKNKIEDMKNVKPEKSTAKMKIPEKQIPSKTVKPKEAMPKVVKYGTSQMSDTPKVKQFPPTDLKPLKSKQAHLSKDVRKPFAIHKRRIQDDEDEHDSELDDFIDDGVQEGNEDYSKYISEIFGYDKSKYKHIDNDDDTAMESSFAQQLKEEYVSAKIGILEDLEDMRMEAMEKKRKALLRKKMKR